MRGKGGGGGGRVSYSSNGHGKGRENGQKKRGGSEMSRADLYVFPIGKGLKKGLPLFLTPDRCTFLIRRANLI